MAYGGGDRIDITLPAAADLSSNQYRFVTVDANGRGTTASGPTSVILGIQQNKPSAQDAPLRIRTAGISRMIAGAALNEADMVASNSQGFGTAAAATSVGVIVGGIVLAAVGGSGDIADVLVSRFEI